ncbi:hypothetical protein ZIOFF_028971 [Zingiber officinale]|uniref:Methylenetetrahydrofolate reductase n=1 Tax=Zingiber officinale TaxID=94328 RepID=A0A8J5GWV0_ZINOF|nr:hypothetical protein ZIOFF_028971 [Zingiber officinale]
MSLVCSLYLPLFWSKPGPAACVPMQVAPASSSTRATTQSSSPSLGRKPPLRRLALEEGFELHRSRRRQHPMKKKLNVQLFAKVTRCLRLPQKTYMDTLTFGAPRFFRHLMDPSSKKIYVMKFEVSKVCMETIMHLTCMNMPVEKIDHALNTIKANGIQNVLALKGDPPHGQDKFVQVAGGFACALDLVQHIRAKYGDYFGITVAGSANS